MSTCITTAVLNSMAQLYIRQVMILLNGLAVQNNSNFVVLGIKSNARYVLSENVVNNNKEVRFLIHANYNCYMYFLLVSLQP